MKRRGKRKKERKGLDFLDKGAGVVGGFLEAKTGEVGVTDSADIAGGVFATDVLATTDGTDLRNGETDDRDIFNFVFTFIISLVFGLSLDAVFLVSGAFLAAEEPVDNKAEDDHNQTDDVKDGKALGVRTHDPRLSETQIGQRKNEGRGDVEERGTAVLDHGEDDDVVEDVGHEVAHDGDSSTLAVVSGKGVESHETACSIPEVSWDLVEGKSSE